MNAAFSNTSPARAGSAQTGLRRQRHRPPSRPVFCGDESSQTEGRDLVARSSLLGLRQHRRCCRWAWLAEHGREHRCWPSPRRCRGSRRHRGERRLDRRPSVTPRLERGIDRAGSSSGSRARPPGPRRPLFGRTRTRPDPAWPRLQHLSTDQAENAGSVEVEAEQDGTLKRLWRWHGSETAAITSSCVIMGGGFPSAHPKRSPCGSWFL